MNEPTQEQANAIANLKYFSIFSGIGGFELGIQNAYRKAVGRSQEDTPRDDAAGSGLVATPGQGTDTTQRRLSAGATDGINQGPLCVGYSEIDQHAIQTYERHFDHANYGDATKIDPKQLPDFDLLVGGFPCQAFSIAGKRAGFDDTRGTLFFEIARICAEKRPRHLVLENVKGLLSHDGGKTFATILGVLTDLGYCVEWQVLNSKDFGVPQNRERVYIVGHYRAECRRQILPIYAVGMGCANPAVTLTARGYGSQRNGTYVDIDPKESQIRRLTPKECERLQGFPDDWTAGVSDTQRYKQCGNAVTVNVAEAVMCALLDDIDGVGADND